MRRFFVWAVLAATACGSRDSTPERREATDQAVTITPSSDLSGDGIVETTFASMPFLRTNEAVKHMFQRAEGVVPERFFLQHLASDGQGTEVHFEIDYLDETSAFDLSGRLGFISITRNGVQSLATAGTVTVAEAEGQILVQFSGLRVAEVKESDGTLSESVALGDGSVIGEVKRVCVLSSNANPPNTKLDPSDQAVISGGLQIDSTWTHEFCAKYASAAPD